MKDVNDNEDNKDEDTIVEKNQTYNSLFATNRILWAFLNDHSSSYLTIN